MRKRIQQIHPRPWLALFPDYRSIGELGEPALEELFLFRTGPCEQCVGLVTLRHVHRSIACLLL
jgi:hypothetical protein